MSIFLQWVAWQKATPILFAPPYTWALDAYGNLIHYKDYGKRTLFGWEIDHIFPASKGGSDHPDNLRPLYWAANRRKSNRLPISGNPLDILRVIPPQRQEIRDILNFARVLFPTCNGR